MTLCRERCECAILSVILWFVFRTALSQDIDTLGLEDTFFSLSFVFCLRINQFAPHGSPLSFRTDLKENGKRRIYTEIQPQCVGRL